MLLERSRILDSAHAKPTVSGMRRIKSTSSVEKSAFKQAQNVYQKEKKSTLSSDESVSAPPLHRNFDQQRARAFKKERMFQTYPVLNKKLLFTFWFIS